MNIFKRKKKRINSWGNEITEQQYVDQEIEALGIRINFLYEKVEILEELNKEKHIFIHNGMYVTIKEIRQWVDSPKAREWAKENGYSYMKTFKMHGELWIKETKAKKE